MVKSYVGPIRQEAAEIKTDKLISAYMTTKVISFHPDLSIYEAMQTLLWNKISLSNIYFSQNYQSFNTVIYLMIKLGNIPLLINYSQNI